MACNSAAWVLGGVRLISSARTMLAKIGPLHEPEDPLAGRGVLLDDLGAGDVAGHQVGRELDAAELQVQGPGQGGDGERLGQAGHADRQAVAAGEQADHHFLDHLVLPDDDLVNLALEQLAGPLDALHGLLGTHLAQDGLGRCGHSKNSWSGNRQAGPAFFRGFQPHAGLEEDRVALRFEETPTARAQSYHTLEYGGEVIADWPGLARRIVPGPGSLAACCDRLSALRMGLKGWGGKNTERPICVAAAVSAAPILEVRSGRDGRRYTEKTLTPVRFRPPCKVACACGYCFRSLALCLR